MTAKIYTFPEIKRKPLTKYVVSIPLYSDAEIDTVIIAVNLYVVDDIRYSSYNIDSLDPDIVRYSRLWCAFCASSNNRFSMLS